MKRWLAFLFLLASCGAAVRAGSLPAQPNLLFQTSSQDRPPTIGDWYTTATSASTDRMHRFAIDVTQQMLTANGGSLSIIINDAACNGALDEVDGIVGATSATTSDPARFELRTGNGVTVLQSRTLPTGSPAGQTATFTVTAPGAYQITSVTGGIPVSGDATASLNDDDNTFSITVPGANPFIGQFQGSLHTAAGSLTFTFYFIVPPGTPSLFLRNFDMDGAGAPLVYQRPGGATSNGTISGNGLWNGAGATLDTGSDNLNGLTLADAGVWSITATNFTAGNQFIFEANAGATRLPITDTPPPTAGNFAITPDTTRITPLNTPVDHPFTVTNLSFLNDIIELSTSNTVANFTVQLLDGAGNPITDSTGDSRLDTGILTPNQTKNFILRVTPQPGAVGPDPTRVNGVSFLATRVNPATAATLFVTKTTSLTPADVSGFVYLDANRNLFKDATENGTGLVLFAKLVPAASPAGPALLAVTVDAATGAYAFPSVSAGIYSIVIDNNNVLADVTPTLPAGWSGTEFPGQRRDNISVVNTNVTEQNFGLVQALPLSGRVFADTGAGGGTANDGVLNGAESGIAGVTVRLTDATGATVYDTATTDGAGNYILLVPSTLASGTQLRVVETNASSYLSTGASVGNTAGSYNRASDVTTFALASGTTYTGVNFGDVPDIVFTTDNAQAGLPGNTLVYTHTFTAGSAGNVTFSITRTSSPAIGGWSSTFYLDVNGNGQLDSGDTAITAPIALTAGQTIQILVKEFIPVNAPFDAQDKLTVTANFSYTNASPALASTATRTDLTTVGNPTTAGLTLVKSVDKSTALPGETLTYSMTYTNNSSDVLSNVVIYDSTPAFTAFISASNSPLPANLSGVTLSAPPAGSTGAMRWTFTGTLAPGGSGTVAFRVTVNQ